MYPSKVIPIIQEAGKELLKHYGTVKAFRQKDGSPSDVVTDLDLQTEKFIAERLHDLFPSIGFRGEEYGGAENLERYWLLDPIDGTAHFIRGIPFCTTMIALIESGKVIFSVIYDFVHGHTYHAEKGQGSKKNNKPIHVSKRSLRDAYLAFEMRLDEEKNRDLFLGLKKRCVLLNTINCGFEFSLIAEGKIDGRVTIDPYGDDYDYAAGTLLVAEAGGVVCNVGSDIYDVGNYNFIAVNPAVAKELRALYQL